MGDLIIYACEICGYVLEVIDPGKRTIIEEGTGYSKTLTIANAQLTCCGEPMKRLTPNVTEAAVDKHLPQIIFNDNNSVTVKISTLQHPATEEHHIKWIAVVVGNTVQHVKLGAEDTPEALFHIGEATRVKAYAYCNLHGLWMSEATKDGSCTCDCHCQ